MQDRHESALPAPEIWLGRVNSVWPTSFEATLRSKGLPTHNTRFSRILVPEQDQALLKSGASFLYVLRTIEGKAERSHEIFFAPEVTEPELVEPAQEV